jgi:hypothetical protein
MNARVIDCVVNAGLGYAGSGAGGALVALHGHVIYIYIYNNIILYNFFL